MDFFNFLKNETNLFDVKLVGLYALSAITNFTMIAVIVVGLLFPAAKNPTSFSLFAGSLVVFIISRKYAMDHSSTIIEGVITELRVRMCDKIRQAELISFERIREGYFLNLLTQETTTISEAAKKIVDLFSSAILLIIAFGYIAYISFPSFLTVVGYIVIGIRIYMIKRAAIEGDLIAAFDREKGYFDYLLHLLDGFKEIKINGQKSDDLYHNYLEATALDTRQLKITAYSKLNNMQIFAQLFCFILMAVMVFLFPQFVPIHYLVLLQIIAMLMFINSGPLQDVVGAFPHIERANLAIQKMQALATELEAMTQEEFLWEPGFPRKAFQSLKCSNLRFAYRQEDSEEPQFAIGPFNFNIRRGEIVFIMGGNGEGKSTFLKVLTGLYSPSGGNIFLNGKKVIRGKMAGYRNYFSIIFQDMHLFDRLYGVGEINLDEADKLLEQMHLDDKTAIEEDGRFENIQLSTGQKKRLALIVAELDNRDIYVFDEWATDQDTVFRKYFYEEYLPDLKQRGKTIIAVTQDDKYYGMADRVYKMDYGQLTEVPRGW